MWKYFVVRCTKLFDRIKQNFMQFFFKWLNNYLYNNKIISQFPIMFRFVRSKKSEMKQKLRYFHWRGPLGFPFTPHSPITHVHVRIFWCSYSDTSWDFTREIDWKNWNFRTPFTHCLRHFCAKTPKSKLNLIKKSFK